MRITFAEIFVVFLIAAICFLIFLSVQAETKLAKEDMERCLKNKLNTYEFCDNYVHEKYYD
jgi:hypothetical protein